MKYLQHIAALYQSFISLPVRSQTIFLAVFFCCIFSASFVIGQRSVQILPQSQTVKNITDKATIQNFGKIFRNNFLCAVIILTGFMSFGISTLFAIAYNGFVIGHTFAGVHYNLGLYQSLLLTIPHGWIELTYMILFAVLSIRLSISFGRLLSSNLTDTSFVTLLCSKHTSLLFFMVALAALIETFGTPYIFKVLCL